MALGTLINANNKPAGATLDLDFVTGQMLAMGTAPGTDPVTFDRSTDIEQYWTPGVNRATAADALARGSWHYDDDASTWLPAGAQIWGSRTNQLTYSHDISNAAWTKNGITVDGSGISPVINGTGAYKAINTNTTGSRNITQTVSNFSTSALVAALLVENIDAAETAISIFDNTASGEVASTTLTWATGAAVSNSASQGSNVTSDAIYLGAGPNGGDMYLLYTTGTPVNSGNAGRIYLYPTGFGVNAESVIIHHIQHEVGTYPGPIILTDGSQVTRSADDATVSTAGWLNDGGAGTIVAEVYFPQAAGADQMVIDLNDDTTNNRIYVYRTAAGSIGGVVRAGGTDYATPSVSGYSSAGWAKVAFAFNTNDARLVVDGTAGTPDTSVTLPTGITTAEIAQNVSNASQLNGHIKSLRYYPRALSTAEMEALTA